ncbi:Zinc ABC transporter, inner membrane permease protein ZnuB [Leucobacter sp. 7(1)]|uniref:hypothetical protein n=1 Tax=Leucobacter sp. 7(1) TaxID=1255613 RepID=UPI00097EA13F|nr:hypothetical protein [Leucobacter sp. 7(1)]SJN07949.1 Zinc ABC transporter, inner membrane permease protein ZnuB [Leucobacter sp. 7(1)]
MNATPHTAAIGTLLALTLIGCTPTATPHAPTPQPDAPPTTEPGSHHGDIAGAEEVSEPPLHLVTIDAHGAVGLFDLLSGSESSLGTIAPPVTATSDGRYVFAAREDGFDIIDSAAWTWDHGDHFHYYRGTPALLGTIPGSGLGTTVGGPLATAGHSGVFFPSSGEAVLLDNAALAEGRITESFRIQVTPHAGLLAPLGDGAVVTEVDTPADAENGPNRVRFLTADGTPATTSAPCPSASGAQVTRVGVVIGCSDGAVLGTIDAAGEPHFTHIPLPDLSAAPATEFAGRKGRPAVAGLGTDSGFWLLDTRAQGWKWTASDVPLIRAVAVDDAAGHVVTLDQDGRVRVFSAGVERAVTAPLLTAADLTQAAEPAISLTVDANRAYLGSQELGTVFEIDFADSARIARELRPAVGPTLLAETGR